MIGYAIDGRPIFSHNNRGLLHTDLDNCNGKFDATGNYGYYVKPTFPYLVGVLAPGCTIEKRVSTTRMAPGANTQPPQMECMSAWVCLTSADGEFESDGCEPAPLVATVAAAIVCPGSSSQVALREVP